MRADGTVAAVDIEAVCPEYLADYKHPRAVHFVEGLPMTSTGQADTLELRDKFT